jgi:hypothetical protein
VPIESAVLAPYAHIGIHRDHQGMARFQSTDDQGFLDVSSELKRWVKDLAVNHGKALNLLTRECR